MKLNIDVTLQVSDEQRVRMANVLDGKVSKRQATRNEMKEFVWERGRDWEVKLDDEWSYQFDGDHEGTPEPEPELSLEDLI